VLPAILSRLALKKCQRYGPMAPWGVSPKIGTTGTITDLSYGMKAGSRGDHESVAFLEHITSVSYQGCLLVGCSSSTRMKSALRLPYAVLYSPNQYYQTINYRKHQEA
jgi:hypothetical protein